ncbi:MAG: DUF86 domain-containing protein [Candidatus Heimdallarchaeota archaeon]|nr:DUF86 domain-containing protein [Candidatus Heimdallarchaeota archaeon]
MANGARTNVAIEKLETRIAFTRKKLEILESIIEKENISDLEYIALERCVEILSQAIIDISIWISRFNKMEIPSTNRQIILQMQFIKEFDDDFIKRISLIGAMRNIIVHEYTIIDQDMVIQAGKQLVTDFPAFTDVILRYVKENYRDDNQ